MKTKIETPVCPVCNGDGIVGSLRIVISTGNACSGEPFDIVCIDCGHEFSDDEIIATEVFFDRAVGVQS